MIWRSSYHTRIAQIVDFFTSVLGFVLSYFIAIGLNILYPDIFPPKFVLSYEYYLIAVIISLLYAVLFNQHKAYSYQRFTSLLKEYIIVTKVSLNAFLLITAITFLLGLKNIPRTIVLVFLFISIILFIIQKSLLFIIAKKIREKGRDRKRVLLIGTGTRAKNFISVVKNNFNWGLDIVGLLTGAQEKVGQQIDGIKILDNYKNIQTVLKTFNPEEIIITISTKRFDQIREVLEICETEGVTVRLNSDFFGHITKHVTIDNVFGLNIISFNMVRQSEIELLIKRIIDIIGSLIAILIFSPFMLIAALGIWLTDGRPILYEWNVI
jgi:FlaA1/EpsC-like NDP-sugar epimerase